jgi:hypothetical protein
LVVPLCQWLELLVLVFLLLVEWAQVLLVVAQSLLLVLLVVEQQELAVLRLVLC